MIIKFKKSKVTDSINLSPTPAKGPPPAQYLVRLVGGPLAGVGDADVAEL